MDLPDGSTGDGTRVQIWKCSDNSTPNQQFSYAGGSDNSVPNDVPVKTDVNSAFCLDVAGGATANGTPIQVATCNNNAAQKWNYDNGALKVFGNKCLDVPNGNASNGQQLQIWDCVNNSANQQWTISGNTLMFKNAFCIDLTNGNAANGQRVQIYGCGPASNVNQHWSWGQSSATAPANAPAAASPSTTRGSGKYMNLAWADEFSGSALDTSTWNYEVNCDGGFNNEMECYTSSPSNVYLDGQGNLVIHVQKAGGLANGRTFTSGRINTQNKKSFTYGRMEARLKVPSGRGLWPAFWAMPVNSTYGQWPTSGELDITEILGQTPGTNYGTVHYGAASPYTQLQGVVAGNDLSQNFHTYGLERDATQIRWYLDDVLFFTINSNQTNYWPAGYTPPDRTAWPFTQPFFAIFNLAIGGDWPGAPDASITSANLVVDYIRVYQ
jgi:beta-glucanase (GH16 family)